ncbi:TPA: ABC transporter permease [Candidatus Bathyarchaeota archaeon]|nr:ABC transporter permease [Candidatus Bathyarchaeota archaeon]
MLRPRDVVSFAFGYIRQRKVRVSLNMLGILIGIAAIVALISITQGVSASVTEQVERLGPRTIVVAALGGPFRAEFSLRDVRRIEAIQGVELATPVTTGIADVHGRVSLQGVQIIGIVPDEFKRVFKWIEVEEGRFLRIGDKVAVVLGANVAHPPWSDRDLAHIGGPIALAITTASGKTTRTLRAAGFLSETGSLAFLASPDDQVYVTIETAQRLFDTRAVDRILVEAASDDVVDEVIGSIRDRLGEDVLIISSSFIRETVGSILGLIQGLLVGIAAISLVVAGVGIVNTMTISVMERTREIGILKALGASNRDVLLIFLTEAAVIGVMGGCMGTLVGVILGRVASTVIGFRFGIALEPSTTPDLLGTGIAFAAMTGVMAGFYPAWRAAKLHPVRALRYE